MGTISELDDGTLEITQPEQQRKKTEKKSLRDKWDCNRRSNNWVTGVTKRKEKVDAAERIFEKIMDEN